MGCLYSSLESVLSSRFYFLKLRVKIGFSILYFYGMDTEKRARRHAVPFFGLCGPPSPRPRIIRNGSLTKDGDECPKKHRLGWTLHNFSFLVLRDFQMSTYPCTRMRIFLCLPVDCYCGSGNLVLVKHLWKNVSGHYLYSYLYKNYMNLYSLFIYFYIQQISLFNSEIDFIFNLYTLYVSCVSIYFVHWVSYFLICTM